MGRSRELAELASAYDGSSLGFRNRIINGDMRIDQRNNGASVSGTSGVFSVDRWKVQNNSGAARFNIQQNAGSVTPPAGFTKYLGVTSTGAYSVAAGDVISIVQPVEGYNIADLGWGAAGASSATLSFWVRSSLTGTFGGSVKAAGATSYPFTFSISAANTWEYKTVSISGPTTGSFATDNSTGIEIYWSMGTGSTFNGTAGSWASADYRSATGATSVVGTNGATFYITGVQLEAGSVATPFERRPYGTELALCQRYYWKFENSGGLYTNFGTGYVNVATEAYFVASLKQTMRAMPSMSTTGTAANYEVLGGSNLRVTAASVPALDTNNSSVNQVFYSVQVASGLTAGQGCMLRANNNTSAFLAFSAEL